MGTPGDWEIGRLLQSPVSCSCGKVGSRGQEPPEPHTNASAFCHVSPFLVISVPSLVHLDVSEHVEVSSQLGLNFIVASDSLDIRYVKAACQFFPK